MTKFLPFILVLFCAIGLNAQTDLIISEYVEGWSTNKAIEIYNPTSQAINLKDYQLVRYANGEDTPPAADDWIAALPDVEIAPYKTFVCVIDKRNPEGTGQEAPIWQQLEVRADAFLCADYSISNTLYHNGDDAIALEKTDGTLVDLFGRWGDPRPADAAVGGSSFTGRCWTDTPPFFTGAGVGITMDHTLIRKADLVDGITVNPAMFNPLQDWDTLSANTFDHLGWHQSSVTPTNETPAFSKDVYDFPIMKTASNGDVLGKVEATDAEGDKLSFFINGGNFTYNENDPDDAGDDERLVPFEINKETGEITVIDANAFQYSTNDTIYINISANDGYSETKWITAMALLRSFPVGNSDSFTKEFKMYPNPTYNTVTIVGEKTIEAVQVLNLAGQTIHNQSTNSKTVDLDLNEFNQGIYMVKALFEDGTSHVKSIVKK